MSKKKSMKRPSRLQSAKHWIPTYEGKNIVRGYRKHYGVSLLCAATELKMLEIEVSDKYIEDLKRNEENKRNSKKEQRIFDKYPDSDDNFYYIAGYTSGGAPFGVTWEDMGMNPFELEDEDDLF